MPRYTYVCTSCENEDVKIVALENRDQPSTCTKCKEVSKRKISTPAVSTPLDTSYQVGYTPKDADQIIGKSAEERWVGHAERVSARHESYRQQGGFVDTNIHRAGGVDTSQELGGEQRKAYSEAYSTEFKEGRVPKSAVDVSAVAAASAVVSNKSE